MLEAEVAEEREGRAEEGRAAAEAEARMNKDLEEVRAWRDATMREWEESKVRPARHIFGLSSGMRLDAITANSGKAPVIFLSLTHGN